MATFTGSSTLNYFKVKLPLAGILAMSGGSAGGLVMPFLMTYLLDHGGYVQANVILAGFWIHGCITAIIMVKRRDHPLLASPHSESDPEKMPIINKNGNNEVTTSYHTQSSNDTIVTSGESTGQKRNNCLSTLHSKYVQFRLYYGFLKSKQFLLNWLTIGISSLAYMNLFMFLPSFVKEMGLTNYHASLCVAIMSITEGILHPIFGVMISRRSSFVIIPLILSICTTVASLSTLAASFLLDNWTAIIIYGLMFGFCGSLPIALAGPTIYEYIPLDKLGTVAGLINIPMLLAGLFTPILGE